MRVLLRNVETGRYFLGGDKWTDDPKLALNFERSERAIQSLFGMKLTQVELIIEFGSGGLPTAYALESPGGD
jgi:hypothetical protein